MDEVVYKDPTPTTMKDLKRRLKQDWKNIPLSTLYDLSHSIPQRLQNLIKKQSGACQMLNFWIHVLDRVKNIF